MSGAQESAIVLNSAATFFLTGVIWIVQMVHYPLLKNLERSGFQTHHAFHSSAITPVVAPAMCLELATSVFLAYSLSGAPASLATAGLLLVTVIWLSTFLLQVRYHKRLAKGFDEAAHTLLVRTNWIRTGAWSLKSLTAILLLGSSLAGHL